MNAVFPINTANIIWFNASWRAWNALNRILVRVMSPNNNLSLSPWITCRKACSQWLLTRFLGSRKIFHLHSTCPQQTGPTNAATFVGTLRKIQSQSAQNRILSEQWLPVRKPLHHTINISKNFAKRTYFILELQSKDNAILEYRVLRPSDELL